MVGSIFPQYEELSLYKKHLGKMVVFGSSRIVPGNGFVCCLSAYLYASEHPYQNVALLDLDDYNPLFLTTTEKQPKFIREIYTENWDKSCMTKLPNYRVFSFPDNIDWYTASDSPSEESSMWSDWKFWREVLSTLLHNYDLVIVRLPPVYNTPIAEMIYSISDEIVLTVRHTISDASNLRRMLNKFKDLDKEKVLHPSLISKTNLVYTTPISMEFPTYDIIQDIVTDEVNCLASIDFDNITKCYTKATLWKQIPRKQDVVSAFDRLFDLLD